MSVRVPLLLSLLFFALTIHAAAPGSLAVRVARPFFNPTIGESLQLETTVPFEGRLVVKVLDRDGVSVRSLMDQSVRPPGISMSWDGRDDSGAIVSDESYSFRIDLIGKKRRLGYFPAAVPAQAARNVAVRSYDPASGIIAYQLPAASRVHIQAGTAVVNDQGIPQGPVLRTIVDRQPRVAGAVIDQWNGLDASGAIYIPDQPHFVLSIAASPLPENSVITVGNRSMDFMDAISHRHGRSLLQAVEGHEHHAGLSTIDDIAPRLRIVPSEASWSAKDKKWIIGTDRVQFAAQLQGLAASRFAARSQAVLVFLDGEQIASRKTSSPVAQFTLPVSRQGSHILAVNWVGMGGPVSVSALRLSIGPPLISSP